MDDVVIVREEAAPGSMGDQLQTIHVGVNGQSRRGKHLLQSGVDDPGVGTMFCQGQVCVHQNLFGHVVKVLVPQLALVEGTAQTADQAGTGEGGLVILGLGRCV